MARRDHSVGVEKIVHANRSSVAGIGGCWRPPSMKGTSAKRSSAANQASMSVTIGSSRMPLATRRTRTRGGVILRERTAPTEVALSLPFLLNFRQRTRLQRKGVGADNGVYTGLLPSCGFVATIDGLRSDVEIKKLGRDVDETNPTFDIRYFDRMPFWSSNASI
jgi:hypothetical protein